MTSDTEWGPALAEDREGTKYETCVSLPQDLEPYEIGSPADEDTHM